MSIIGYLLLQGWIGFKEKALRCFHQFFVFFSLLVISLNFEISNIQSLKQFNIFKNKIIVAMIRFLNVWEQMKTTFHSLSPFTCE